MKSCLIYCAGPYATPEDSWQLDEMETALRSREYQAYRPFRDGLDSLYQNLSGLDPQTVIKLAESVFAYNIFCLIEKCNAVVFCMNGRVPDTAGTIISAVAFMYDIPVVLCKQDHRSTFHGHDNAMITGLSRTFLTTRNPDAALKALTRVISCRKKNRSGFRLSPSMARIVAMGRKLDEMMSTNPQLPGGDPGKAMEKILAVYDGFPCPVPPKKSVRTGGLVYCSGPLFCPGEVKMMSGIAGSLESSGWNTYLPHRDGVESFVMKHTDRYTANLFPPLVRFFHRLTFAVDVYYLLKCSGLVFNMNGRVPDEGGVAEIGMAFAAGKPVVLYREASEGSGMEAVDPMVAAIGIQGAPVISIEQIPLQLEQVDPTRYRMDDLTGKTPDLLPPYLQGMVRLGQKAIRIMNCLAFIKPKCLF